MSRPELMRWMSPLPTYEAVFVHIQIASGLPNCDTALAHQPHRLKLKLAAELPLLRRGPPISVSILSRCPPNRQQARKPGSGGD